MTKSADRVEEVLAALKTKGYRLTPQRLAVVRALVESTDHPSVERIYEKVRRQHPMISRATVYKTVETLKGMAEVLELEFSGTSNRYDGRRVEAHPHLFCQRCGRIEDLDLPDLMREAAEVVERAGYELIGHRLDFYGLCPACQERQAGVMPARKRRSQEVGGR